MSIMLFAQVYKMGFEYFPKNGPTVKSVLLALSDCASPSKEYDGFECWPSISAISKKTLLNERTIFRCLNELESLGYIKRINRIDENNGRSKSNIYQLCLPAVVFEPSFKDPGVTQSQGESDTESGGRMTQSHTNPNIETKREHNIYPLNKKTKNGLASDERWKEYSAPFETKDKKGDTDQKLNHLSKADYELLLKKRDEHIAAVLHRRINEKWECPMKNASTFLTQKYWKGAEYPKVIKSEDNKKEDKYLYQSYF